MLPEKSKIKKQDQEESIKKCCFKDCNNFGLKIEERLNSKLCECVTLETITRSNTTSPLLCGLTHMSPMCSKELSSSLQNSFASDQLLGVSSMK